MQMEANCTTMKYLNPDVVYNHTMNNKIVDFQDYLACVNGANSDPKLTKQLGYQHNFAAEGTSYTDNGFMSRQHSYPNGEQLSPEA